MAKINDGGPAFPTPEIRAPDGTGIQEGALGMSFRDWSAVQIAAGMVAYSGTLGLAFGPSEIAKRAYEVTDAMLAERERRP